MKMMPKWLHILLYPSDREEQEKIAEKIFSFFLGKMRLSDNTKGYL